MVKPLSALAAAVIVVAIAGYMIYLLVPGWIVTAVVLGLAGAVYAGRRRKSA